METRGWVGRTRYGTVSEGFFFSSLQWRGARTVQKGGVGGLQYEAGCGVL